MDDLVKSNLVADERTHAAAGAVKAPVAVKLWLKRHLIFTLTVLMPTICAVVYYSLIASDIYVSESRFVVRSPESRTQASGLLGQFLQGTGISHSEDDAYAVQNFILSRDALKELTEKLKLEEAYGSHRFDVFDRFPGLRLDRSFERFFQYYGKHVGVSYDPASSISVLTVRAFTAADAYRINRMLLDMSERLVNRLNDRSRQDLVRFAKGDVEAAETKARDASVALLVYRRQHSVFEPNKQATIQLEGVAKLQAELISTEAELAQLKKLSPSNPQIPGLESRADTLHSATENEAAKVTGGNGSLSARAADFERLALQSAIADKELGVALSELDSARRDAARQQLYLERLVQPNLPDSSLEPRRLRSVLTVFTVGLILWGVLTLVTASVREHTQ